MGWHRQRPYRGHDTSPCAGVSHAEHAREATGPGTAGRLVPQGCCLTLFGDDVDLRAYAVRGDPEVQGAALELCAVLVSRAECPEILSTGRELVRACLAGNDKKVRLRAIQVALFPGMDLLETVAGLLVDAEVEVRRAAILAVGPADKVVLDETLLPCLCDKDDEVRLTCEMALKGRGLKPEHLEMARLSVDPEPRVRLRVLDHLRRSADLDHGIWLRRLSHDPAPSVRAAAIRAISQQTGVNLTDRIDQMAQSDPSPTVCYLATIYLKHCRTAAQTDPGQE
jgi:HEAT repeats